MIVTNDGHFSQEIIHPSSNIEKEYLVKVKGSITPEKLQQLCHGLSLDGKKLKKAKVKKVGPDRLNFILKEGKKRQIRRMCELVDLKVIALKRIRIGKLELGKLPTGKWRLLKNKEFID